MPPVHDVVTIGGGNSGHSRTSGSAVELEGDKVREEALVVPYALLWQSANCSQIHRRRLYPGTPETSGHQCD